MNKLTSASCSATRRSNSVFCADRMLSIRPANGALPERTDMSVSVRRVVYVCACRWRRVCEREGGQRGEGRKWLSWDYGE